MTLPKTVDCLMHQSRCAQVEKSVKSYWAAGYETHQGSTGSLRMLNNGRRIWQQKTKDCTKDANTGRVYGQTE